MIDKPLVSILMNCFNGELYLNEALNSVINQCYKNWELIFWDNKSTDRSIEIVSHFKDKRIRIFQSKKHTNLGEARKDAFKQIKGKYLAFLDVDDIWQNKKLSEQIREFEDNELGISFTNSLYFSENRKENLYKSKNNFYLNTKNLITNYPLSLNSIMINVNKIKKLNYDFDPKFSHISDFDLMVRLSAISKIKYLNKVLSGWRIHGKNESLIRRKVFNKEIELWCKFHLKNRYLIKYKKQIKELRLLNFAEKRINSYGLSLSSIKSINLNDFSNNKNKLYIIFSLIPILPKIILILKSILFNLKWLDKTPLFFKPK